MNIYKLSLSGINVAEGIKRFNNNEPVYEKYLKKLITDPNFDILCDSIQTKNADEAFKAAHALKGVAGNLSVSKLYDDICPLVEELRKGNVLKAKELFVDVQQDYNRIVDALDETK